MVDKNALQSRISMLSDGDKTLYAEMLNEKNRFIQSTFNRIMVFIYGASISIGFIVNKLHIISKSNPDIVIQAVREASTQSSMQFTLVASFLMITGAIIDTIFVLSKSNNFKKQTESFLESRNI